MAASDGAKVTWGILGTGAIARTFARGIAASETGTLLAVGSRSQEAADRFGDELGVARRYPSYQELLADPDVQVVYISLPNHLHAEWTIKCAQAGKHILCEKPLTTNYAEAMRVMEEIRCADVFLMEAFMYRCHPQTARLKELIDAGAIGDVRVIECSFSYNMGPRYENIRLSNAAAGGAIMDVGCYTTSMARLLAGAEPDVVTGTAQIGDTSRVDECAAASLHFPNGAVANLLCGTQVQVESAVRVWGTAGRIHVPNPWFPQAGSNRIVLQRIGDREPTEILVEGGGELYAIEADTVARHIAGREAPSPSMTWADSLGNMATLDRWRRMVGLTFDVEKPQALRQPAARPHSPVPMTYGRIPGIDKDVSRLIMGTMVFSPQDLAFTCAMLDHFVALGGNALDTAHQYGRGDAERAVGEWMAVRGNREELVLITKGGREERLGRGLRVNPAAITSDLADSLERLQTDYIDLYLLHRDDPDYPVEALIDCLNEHHRAGRIRAFGASNWSIERLQAANTYAREHGLRPFVASSPNFSLAVWNEPPWAGCLSASVEGRGWYEERQFPLLSWSSQAQGFFTGRYTPADRSNAEMVRCWYSPQNFARLERAQEIAQRRGVTATAIAVAYVLSQSFPTFALIGPHAIAELRTSAEALTVALSPAELRWLNLEEAQTS